MDLTAAGIVRNGEAFFGHRVGLDTDQSRSD